MEQAMKSWIILFTMPIGVLFGCTTTSKPREDHHETIVQSEQSISVAANFSNGDEVNRLVLKSHMLPSVVSKPVYDCLQQKFSFQVRYDNSDYFFCRVLATTADNHVISVAFRWKNEGDTEISISSNLDYKPEFDFILAAIKDSIVAKDKIQPAFTQ
jgi:hypothetical protein